MGDPFTLALLVYSVGVLVGVTLTDARPAGRVALALLWPIGPLAFLVTIATLLLAALVPLSGALTRVSPRSR
jgi:hypothetical protein